MDVSYLLVGAASAIAAVASVTGVTWAINRKGRGRNVVPASVGEVAARPVTVESPSTPEVRHDAHRSPAPTPDPPVISESELRARLAAATNFEECLAVHRLAGEGGALEREAIEKFNRTARTELATLISIQSCWRFYHELPTERIGESRMVANEVLEKMLTLVSTSEEAKELHDEYVNQCEDDQFAARVRTRYNELARSELAAITTSAKCFEFFENLPDDDFAAVGSIADEAIERAMVLATTHTEARELFDDYVYDNDDEAMVAKLSARLATLLRVRLGELATVDECSEFLSEGIPSDEEFVEGSALVQETYERILLLATTVDDVGVVYDQLDESDSQEFRDRVLTRALDLTTSIEDASWVLDNAEGDSELEQAAMNKWLSLVTAVSECEGVWTNYGIDSEIGQLAILRAAEIIRSDQEASAT